jgi:hypothetical protein
VPDQDDPNVIDDTDAEREVRRALETLAEQEALGIGPTRDQLASAARALRDT